MNQYHAAIAIDLRYVHIRCTTYSLLIEFRGRCIYFFARIYLVKLFGNNLCYIFLQVIRDFVSGLSIHAAQRFDSSIVLEEFSVTSVAQVQLRSDRVKASLTVDNDKSFSFIGNILLPDYTYTHTQTQNVTIQ